MKVTREIIDNNQKIIHVNYTKKEKNKLRDKNDKMIMDIAEANRRRIEEEQKREMEEKGITSPTEEIPEEK